MTKLAWATVVVAALVACGDAPRPGALSDAAPPAPVCDPVKQTGCAAGDKCTWIYDRVDNPATPANEDLGHIGCAPPGDRAVGQACWYGDGAPGGSCTTSNDCGNPDASNPDRLCIQGACVPALRPGVTGASNCLAGAECLGNECRTVCDPQVAAGASGCSAAYGCATYAGIYEDAEGNTVAGVCDPTCDVITQERAVGTPTAACGSPEPDAPAIGCYLTNTPRHGLLPSTCARVPLAVRALRPTAPVTDRQLAYAPSDFDGALPYRNGCEPGYAPLIEERTGSVRMICVGLCIPRRTDSANPGGARGDASRPAKLPTKVAAAIGDGVCAAGKKGSTATQDCRYLWPLISDDTRYFASPLDDTLGYCYDFSEYQTDPDGPAGPLPPEDRPSCTQLPPKGTTANCTCAGDPANPANALVCSGTGCPRGLAHEPRHGCYSKTDTLAGGPTAADAPDARAVTTSPLASQTGLRLPRPAVRLVRHRLE